MKTRIVGMLSLLLVAMVASAALAKGPDGEARKEKMWQRVVQKLDLTAEQQTQLKPVFEARTQQMKAHREARRTQMDSILTDEQKARLEKIKADRKAAREKGEKIDFRSAWKSLNLTDEQKARMKTLRQQNREQMKAEHQQFVARVESMLNPTQKAAFEEMMTRRGKRQHKNQQQKQ